MQTCHDCPSKALPGKSRCKACLDKLRAKSADRARARRAARRDDGLCPECGQALPTANGSPSLVIGELTRARAVEALSGQLAQITYSDPPWGPGNLMYWRTHNGETNRPSWSEFLELFCDIVSSNTERSGHIFVEMGLRWVDELAAAMARFGRSEAARFHCLYGNPKLPNVLWYSGPGTSLDPSGLSGVKMTHAALDGVAMPGALVFDPCCGKGMTARCALRLGMRFAGVELNPKRAKVTQDWLDRFAAGKAR